MEVEFYFYPRPPRGGRRRIGGKTETGKKISIHALREEGDWAYFYGTLNNDRFLSTPSARRATRSKPRAESPRLISIHALREEGDLVRVLRSIFVLISIHALREEGDASAVQGENRPKTFLSTPSARRATKELYLTGTSTDISIHALREEGDLLMAGLSMFWSLFLSTPSARRATLSHVG